MLKDSALKLLSKPYDYALRQALTVSPLGYDQAVWEQMAELGWLALPVPENAGGLGGDAFDLGALMEAAGEYLALEPLLPAAVLGIRLLALLDPTGAGDELEVLMSGGRRLALAHDLSGGPAADVADVVATVHGGVWSLHGRKALVRGGEGADAFLVSASTGGGRVGVFRVSVDAPGVSSTVVSMLDGSRALDITFSDVAAVVLVGGREDAADLLQDVLDLGLVASCFEAVGALTYLVRVTRDHCNERVQFGKSLSSFQAVRHQLARMAIAAEEAEKVAWLAGLALTSPDLDRRRMLSAAKSKLGRTARLVSKAAVQLHGGMGVTEELSVGAYLKKAITFDLTFGSAEFHDRIYARMLREGVVGAGEAFVCTQQSQVAEREAAA